VTRRYVSGIGLGFDGSAMTVLLVRCWSVTLQTTGGTADPTGDRFYF
jgi:hypothetical protein